MRLSDNCGRNVGRETTYIPGALIMGNDIFMICPNDHRTGSETRKARKGCGGKASGQHGGRWGEVKGVGERQFGAASFFIIDGPASLGAAPSAN